MPSLRSGGGAGSWSGLRSGFPRSVREQAAFHRMEKEKQEMLLFLSGGASEAFMSRAIDTLLERYGSAENYLEQELGIGAAEREALRARFLEKSTSA